MRSIYTRPVRQFLMLLVALALTPALCIIVYSAIERHREAVRQTEQSIGHLTESMVLHQESLVTSTRQFLATLGEVPAIQNHDLTASQRLLAKLHKQNPHYVNILLADPDGYIFANAVNVPGFSVTDRKYFKDVLTNGRFSAGEFVISRSTQKPVLNYAAPVVDRTDKLAAVLIVGLELSYYDQLLTQTRLPAGTGITLTDHRGTILHQSPLSIYPAGTADPHFEQMRTGALSGAFQSDSGTGLHLNAWRALKLTGQDKPYLYIRLNTPEFKAVQPVILVALRDIALLIIAAGLALLVTWLLGNRGIVRPTQRLAQAAAAIHNGDLTVRMQTLQAPHELQLLIDNFNRMAETLAQRSQEHTQILQELQQSREQYRIVADYTLDWEYWIDTNGAILYMSPATQDMTGYTREEFISSPRLLVDIIHPDDRHWMQSHIRYDLTKEGTVAQELRIITKQGEVRWISHTCQQVFDNQGQPAGRRACNRDINDRKQAELALIQQSNSLEQLNLSLQERISDEVRQNREKDRLMMLQGRQAAMGEMISNIAHQWRQPLNNLGLMIQGLQLDYTYGELTEEHLKQSTEHGMELIQFMSSTIDDFRNFFKPNKQKSRFSLQTVAQRALGFVSASLEDNRIETRLEVLHEATAYGFPNECAQALINLLNNARDALREHRPALPCITISINLAAEGPCIAVSDNGGGIPPEIIDRIFEPYYTTKEQGQGTGIGLYMAKTIIEKNMGGHLTAHNHENGAVFTIILPPPAVTA